MTSYRHLIGKKKSMEELYEDGCKLGLQKEMKAVLLKEMKKRGLLSFPDEVYEI